MKSRYRTGLFVAATLSAIACSSADQDETRLSLASPGADVPAAEAELAEELGREGPNQCGSSVERNLANLAGAAAEQLGRWEVVRDFQLSADGTRLELSAEGAAACRDGECGLVRGVLALQRPELAAPDNDPEQLAAALVSGWKRQLEHDGASAPVEDYELTRVGTEPSTCGSMFWFAADRTNCSGECGVPRPELLSSRLVFAGFPDNPYLQFQSSLDFRGQPTSVVGIDPVYGPGDDGGSSCTGACPLGCVKVFESPPTGCDTCCSCNGVNTTWKPTTYSPYVYLCH